MAGSRTGAAQLHEPVARLNSRQEALPELTATEQLLTSEDGGQEGRETVCVAASLLGSVDLRAAT